MTSHTVTIVPPPMPSHRAIANVVFTHAVVSYPGTPMQHLAGLFPNIGMARAARLGIIQSSTFDRKEAEFMYAVVEVSQIEAKS